MSLSSGTGWQKEKGLNQEVWDFPENKTGHFVAER